MPKIHKCLTSLEWDIVQDALEHYAEVCDGELGEDFYQAKQSLAEQQDKARRVKKLPFSSLGVYQALRHNEDAIARVVPMTDKDALQAFQDELGSANGAIYLEVMPEKVED